MDINFHKANTLIAFFIMPWLCYASLSTSPITEKIDSLLNINNSSKVYIDQENNKDWKTVYDLLKDADLYDLDEIPNYGKFKQSQRTYWIYFSLITPSTAELDQLVFLRTKSRGRMQLYQIKDQKLIKESKSGYYIPKIDHPHQFRQQSKFDLPIHLQGGERYDFLLKLKSSVNFKRNFDIILYDQNHRFVKLENQKIKVYFILGGFMITLGVMGLFALIIFLHNKEQAFLFYFIYVFSILIFYIRLYSMLNPDWFILPHFWHKYTFYLPVLCSIYISYAIFIMHFLNTKVDFPKFHRFIKGFLWSILSLFLVDRILILLDPHWSFQFTFYARYSIHLCTIAFLIYLMMNSRSKLEWFVITGSSILIASLIISQSISYHKVFLAGFLDFSDIPVLLGILLELICLFLGLGYKVKLLEKEKIEADKNLLLSKQKSDHLQDLNEMRNNVYTGITHEFRTPLTLILGLAEKLKSEINSARVKKDLSLIKKNGKQLLKLVNKILDVSKLEEH